MWIYILLWPWWGLLNFLVSKIWGITYTYLPINILLCLLHFTDPFYLSAFIYLYLFYFIYLTPIFWSANQIPVSKISYRVHNAVLLGWSASVFLRLYCILISSLNSSSHHIKPLQTVLTSSIQNSVNCIIFQQEPANVKHMQDCNHRQRLNCQVDRLRIYNLIQQWNSTCCVPWPQL